MRLLPAINTRVVAFARSCCVQKRNDGTLDYWLPSRTGDWTNDCTTGRLYAIRTIEYIRREKNPVAMASILRAMVKKGEWGGCEAGFVQTVVAHLMPAED